MMSGLLDDLRYGLRGLTRNRGFAVVALLSLALGIGANTSIFTLLNALFLSPVPVHNPGQLAAVFTTDPRNPGLLPVSYPNFQEYRDHNDVFSSLLLYAPATINLTGRGDPQLLMAQLVSANYFRTLGLVPLAGRDFRPEEDVAPGAAVVILSYGLWQRLFQGNPGVTGKSIELNGRSYAILGVAPANFYGLTQLNAPDVYLPFSVYPQVIPSPAMVPQRRALLFSAVGRLKPGVAMGQAQASLQTLARQLERLYPRENLGRGVTLTTLADAARNSRARPMISRVGALLMTIASLVLLIACANVANLLLARATSRQKEIALRLALGSTRARLVRMLLTESLLLSVFGGAAGLLIARWGRDILWVLRPPMFSHAGFRLDLDGTVLLFTLGISVATGLLFGLAPALRATRTDLAGDLKERAASTSSFHRHFHPRSVLVMAQIALSLIALIGASLFLRSLRTASAIDPGFDSAHLAIIAYNVTDQGYNEARGREFHQRAVQEVAAIPGVRSAALARDLPFHVASIRTVLLDGQEAQGRATLTSVVAPGYFQTTGIALLRGRDFTQLDTKTTPRVVIVNQTAANAFWPGEDPIGKRITFAGEGLPVEVIGVARTANYQSVGESPQALVYLSLVQYYFPTAVLYIRTAGDPAALLGAARRELQTLDRNFLLQAETLETSTHDLLWAQRLAATLLAIFGGLALFLSTIGIYGLISYNVRRRTREIGIRIALGATPSAVQRMVLGDGVRLVAIGVLAGSVVAFFAAGQVSEILFLSNPRDVFTFTLVPAILTLAAILACWIPAMRATAIPTATALRDE